MKRVPILIPFLALVSTIFIGILIYAYFQTAKAHPEMLDEQGHPVRLTQVACPASIAATRSVGS